MARRPGSARRPRRAGHGRRHRHRRGDRAQASPPQARRSSSPGATRRRLRTRRAEIGAQAIAADVSDEASVAALFASIDAGAGGPDILVNNAGITGPVARAADIDMAAWDETMAINVRGTILCIKYAVPRMRARGGGSIINMSSLMGLRGTPMRSAYTASKYAVLGITDAVSQEVGVDNIRVNALCPGAVNGELMQRVIAARVAKRKAARPRTSSARNYTDKASLRRWVEPEEVAAAALFSRAPHRPRSPASACGSMPAASEKSP